MIYEKEENQCLTKINRRDTTQRKWKEITRKKRKSQSVETRAVSGTDCHHRIKSSECSYTIRLKWLRLVTRKKLLFVTVSNIAEIVR